MGSHSVFLETNVLLHQYVAFAGRVTTAFYVHARLGCIS